MKTYTITFTGRQSGAIGICYRITETVTAENEDAARIKLYDKYELISRVEFIEHQN